MEYHEFNRERGLNANCIDRSEDARAKVKIYESFGVNVVPRSMTSHSTRTRLRTKQTDGALIVTLVQTMVS